MHDSIWQSIASTPWWAFVLFWYFMYAGYLATKPRALPVRHLFLSPIFFIAMTFMSAYLLIHPQKDSIMCFAAMLMLGTGLGWLHYRVLKIKAIKDKRQLQLPGTFSFLIIFLTVFTLKNYYDFNIDLSPELFRTTPYAMTMMSIYGFFTGILIGRLYYAVYTVKHGPFVLTD